MNSASNLNHHHHHHHKNVNQITEQSHYQSNPNYNLNQSFQTQVFHHPSRPSSQPQSNSSHPSNPILISSPSPQLLQSQSIINQSNYNKLPNLPQHQAPSPIHPIIRPSQHQMAQHLMNPQAHTRSQRLLQQQQQQQQQQLQQQQIQRYEEIMMITDPLDSLNNRSLALRRFTSSHANMNSLLGNHWTVNSILKGDHKPSIKRKLSHSTDPNPNELTEQDSNRTERLKRKLEKIQVDIEKSRKTHQLQLQMILDRSIPILQSKSN
ncbi:hypothetical protein DFH28DRAFT_1041202, partial [Melampsora americana]